MDIEFCGELRKLTLGPNDVLVVNTDLVISLEQAQTIKERVVTVYGNVPCLVLSEGLRLSAVDLTALVDAAVDG